MVMHICCSVGTSVTARDELVFCLEISFSRSSGATRRLNGRFRSQGIHDVKSTPPTRDPRLHHRHPTRRTSDASELLPCSQIVDSTRQKTPLRVCQVPFPQRSSIMEENVPGAVKFPCSPYAYPVRQLLQGRRGDGRSRGGLDPSFSPRRMSRVEDLPYLLQDVVPLPVPPILAHHQVSQSGRPGSSMLPDPQPGFILPPS